MDETQFLRLITIRNNLIKQAIVKHKILKIKITGNSMLPSFSTSEITLIGSLDRNLCIGDVVLFLSAKNTLVFHRIIKQKDNYFTLKGDNEDYIDVIHLSQILGLHKKGLKEPNVNDCISTYLDNICITLHINNGLISNFSYGGYK